MHYPEFIGAVAERAGVPNDDAEALTRATLETLAERLGMPYADKLAAELPKPLKELLKTRDREPDDFGPEEFINRTKARSDVPLREVNDGVRAVMATLRDAISTGEYGVLVHQLPDYGDLLQQG